MLKLQNRMCSGTRRLLTLSVLAATFLLPDCQAQNRRPRIYKAGIKAN